jgi:hypothetical protein
VIQRILCTLVRRARLLPLAVKRPQSLRGTPALADIFGALSSSASVNSVAAHAPTKAARSAVLWPPRPRRGSGCITFSVCIAYPVNAPRGLEPRVAFARASS